jgi:hypothetical protein
MAGLGAGHVQQMSLEPGPGTEHVPCRDLTQVSGRWAGHVRSRDQICPKIVSGTQKITRISLAKGLRCYTRRVTGYVQSKDRTSLVNLSGT